MIFVCFRTLGFLLCFHSLSLLLAITTCVARHAILYIVIFRRSCEFFANMSTDFKDRALSVHEWMEYSVHIDWTFSY